MTSASKKAATPIDELKQRIAAEQDALDRLQLRAVELQEERKAALLADGDEQLEDVEASIQSTLRQAERHRARLDAFLVELEKAEEEQRHAEALADYSRAATEVQKAKELLMVNYPRAATELAEILARVQAADKLAERVNRELPDGCAPLRPPSNVRHVARESDRREVRQRVVWVNAQGQEIRGIQIVDGKPTVQGARQVTREEEVVVTGRSQWFPVPIYTEVCLPALERDQPDFWRP